MHKPLQFKRKLPVVKWCGHVSSPAQPSPGSLGKGCRAAQHHNTTQQHETTLTVVVWTVNSSGVLSGECVDRYSVDTVQIVDSDQETHDVTGGDTINNNEVIKQILMLKKRIANDICETD